MNKHRPITQLLSSSSREELEYTIICLIEAYPLNDAYSRSILNCKDAEYVKSIITAELEQLIIWLRMDFNLGAYGSTLITEKSFFVFEIAENLSKNGRYQESVDIFFRLLKFGGEILQLNTYCDAEVEILTNEIFRVISNWNKNDIPKEQFYFVISTLEECSNLECLNDVGYDEKLREAYGHLVG